MTYNWRESNYFKIDGFRRNIETGKSLFPNLRIKKNSLRECNQAKQ